MRPPSPTARVTATFLRIADADRPEIWITLREQPDVVAHAEVVERRFSAGESLQRHRFDRHRRRRHRYRRDRRSSKLDAYL
jgi:hypothetical protein